jgi:acyl-ACP thioesterase
MSVPHFTCRERVRFFEAGPDGRMRPDALFDLLQDVAGRHAFELGLAVPQLQPRGLSWALTRERVLVERWPGAHEELLVETWPGGRERQVLYRDFRLVDSAGAPIASASSAWVVIERATRQSVASLDELLSGIAIAEGPQPGFAARTIPAVREADHAVALRPRRADLDLNGHVNHARILSLLLEALPDASGGELKELDVLFRAEVKWPEELVARCASLGRGCFRHSLVRHADGAELARAASFWS